LQTLKNSSKNSSVAASPYFQNGIPIRNVLRTLSKITPRSQLELGFILTSIDALDRKIEPMTLSPAREDFD
jgi:hypothetical protein